jgi:hypothetical protein
MALFPANAETLFVTPDIWVVSNPYPYSPPPRLRHPSVAGVKRVDLILVNSLPAHSASGAARREALCLSGHTELVPEDARRT